MTNFVIDNNANNIANLQTNSILTTDAEVINSVHTEDLRTSSVEVYTNLKVTGDGTMENMIVNTLAFDKLQIRMEEEYLHNSTVDLKTADAMTSAQVALKSQSDSVGILDFTGSTSNNGGFMDVEVSFFSEDKFSNDNNKSLVVMLSLETFKNSSVRLIPDKLNNRCFQLRVIINESLEEEDVLKVHYFIMETNTLQNPSTTDSTKSELTIQEESD